MSDEMLVRHCSPTLAGMKTGSMFSCRYNSRETLFDDVRQMNRRLVPRGLRVLPLQYAQGRALIYLFRPNALKSDLSDELAVSLLRERGYQDIRVESCICQLMARFRESEEFPHEVGLFLGYPPEDVFGFIHNKACGHKCVGCWKVYGDEVKARKTFAQYEKCTKVYQSQWKKGKTIERLTVAG